MVAAAGDGTALPRRQACREEVASSSLYCSTASLEEREVDEESLKGSKSRRSQSDPYAYHFRLLANQAFPRRRGTAETKSLSCSNLLPRLGTQEPRPEWRGTFSRYHDQRISRVLPFPAEPAKVVDIASNPASNYQANGPAVHLNYRRRGSLQM